MKDGADRKTSAPPTEIECKYRVRRLPALTDSGRQLRQGYIAVDHPVSVRIRDDAGHGCQLTIKSGKGAVRQEVEIPISRDVFDHLWPMAVSRSLEKTRYLIGYKEHKIELDVFHGKLEGLIVAEVEFESLADLQAFEPPDWFEEDLTDDLRYTNVSLATEKVLPPL